MDNRNYVNSEYYAKLLREKIKRDNKVAKMQNRIASDKSPVAQQRSLIPRKSKSRSTPDKLPKSASAGKRSDMEKSHSLMRQKQLSLSDNDLLSEIDKSLSGIAQGFLNKQGN